MQSFSIEEIYNNVFSAVGSVINDRTLLAAWMIGLAIFFAVFALAFWLEAHKSFFRTAIIAFVFAFIGFTLVKGDLPAKMKDIGGELADTAINAGVDNARLAQATELQYISAPVVKYGYETLSCNFTANRDVTSRGSPNDKCLQETGWFSYRKTNQWTKTIRHCSTDDEGHETCYNTYVDHWDDEFTPYFSFVVRYWIEPDTKTKYLHSGVYQMQDDGGKPQVFLHAGWRAPQNPDINTYNNRGLDGGWQYNNHVPEFWTRVQNAAETSGPIVLATFVGPYFNWGFASESTQFSVYSGPYIALKKLVTLPGPDKATINYVDAFNGQSTMHTLLASTDGELPLDFMPTTVLGVNIAQADLINLRALAFQGHLGPNKQGIASWFIVSKTLTDSLGGLSEMTIALKAYMNDSSVWGLFALPKNQVILVTEVSDDGTQIVNRDMETGMPMGNVLVEQRMRLSVNPQNALPFSPDTMIGTFTSSYTKNEGGALSYTYSDMATAGGAASILYEQSKDWVAPDPNAETCEATPDYHLGFIRYRMCTQQYLKTTIKVNKAGFDLINQQATTEAENRTPIVGSIILLFVAFCFSAFFGYAAVQES